MVVCAYFESALFFSHIDWHCVSRQRLFGFKCVAIVGSMTLMRCFAIAMDMLRLTVCWNHSDGVAVWYVSPYVSVDSSRHMELTPCSRCCGELAANV